MKFIYSNTSIIDSKYRYFPEAPKKDTLVYVTDDKGNNPRLAFTVFEGLIVLKNWNSNNKYSPCFVPDLELKSSERYWWYAPENTVVSISYNE